MINKLTPTQVHELKQALKDKTNAPHHRKIQALILYSENQNQQLAQNQWALSIKQFETS